MKKQKFDNAGVDLVQTHILSLPGAMRQPICNLMRLSLPAAMDELFDLHPNQQTQLANMPANLSEALGTAIARNWETGQKVFFDKETKDEDDLPDRKVLEVIGIDEDPEDPEDPEAPPAEEEPPAVPLMVRIRYR